MYVIPNPIGMVGVDLAHKVTPSYWRSGGRLCNSLFCMLWEIN